MHRDFVLSDKMVRYERNGLAQAYTGQYASPDTAAARMVMFDG